MNDTPSMSWDDQRELELSAQVISTATAPYRPVLESFAAWLSLDRGLAPATIHSSLSCARRFLDRIGGHTDPAAALFKSLTGQTIESFFLRFDLREVSVGTRTRLAGGCPPAFAICGRSWMGEPSLGEIGAGH